MDYTGKQIGDIKILKRATGDLEKAQEFVKKGKKGGYSPRYECECLLCGKIFEISIAHIKSKVHKNCGCEKLQYNLKGKRFDKLTVIKKIGLNKHNEILWECVCDCGEKILKTSFALRTSNNNQCKKCANNQIALKNKKYELYSIRLRKIYTNMKSRCYNPNVKSYHLYGERGIKVCDEWLHSYITFQNWAVKNGYKEDLTIDRIDNNGNYEPNNCRWVDRRVQANNRKSNFYITFNNKTDTLANWCNKLNLVYHKVQHKLYKGISFEDIVTGKN